MSADYWCFDEVVSLDNAQWEALRFHLENRITAALGVSRVVMISTYWPPVREGCHLTDVDWAAPPHLADVDWRAPHERVDWGQA